MKQKRQFAASVELLGAFVLWTLAVRWVDVQSIGPEGSAVGFATVNRVLHRLTGVHMGLYMLTDWLGLVPVAVGMGFGILGLAQWIRRRSLWKVDRSILVLGGFYLVVIAVYVLFESVVINYRPVLINGFLEASYPSSTTLLVLCVMPTAWLQLRSRIKHRLFKSTASVAIGAFTAFMVVGRFFSGVHWFTDIVGGALLSASLVGLYRSASGL